MAKSTVKAPKGVKVTESVDALRPYVERALTDPAFRKDLQEALAAAKGLWGDVAKAKGKNGSVATATRLATDKDVYEDVRKALASVAAAGTRVKGKPKKKHKVRNTALVAGVVAGALYNPWTGPQTREWLMAKVAGDDDLQPLGEWGEPSPFGEAAESAEETVAEAAESVSETASVAADENADDAA
jgi:hypothetical protein